MRVSWRHCDWYVLRPARSKRSAPSAMLLRSVSSGVRYRRAFSRWPCANITPGTRPWMFFGRYRLPVTKKPGALSK
jgi:hypothetical protein